MNKSSAYLPLILLFLVSIAPLQSYAEQKIVFSASQFEYNPAQYKLNERKISCEKSCIEISANIEQFLSQEWKIVAVIPNKIVVREEFVAYKNHGRTPLYKMCLDDPVCNRRLADMGQEKIDIFYPLIITEPKGCKCLGESYVIER